MAELKNTIINDTSALQLPVGTTAERPGFPVDGYMRFNSDEGKVEYYSNSEWVFLPSGPEIVTDGLVLYLDAGNPESYPGTGNTWFDLSTSNVNATLFNGPIFDSQNFGSLDFDGSNDYASLNASSFNFSSEQTIMIGLKPEEADSNRRNPYNQAYGGYGTITHETNGTFNYYHGTSGTNSSPYQGTNSSFTVNQNEISIISVSRSPSIVKWYKNSSMVSSQANSYPTANNSVNTILIADGYTNNYLGKIYFVLLYNKSLSDLEIQQNFNFFKDRFGL